MSTFTLEPQYLYKLASMPRGFTTNQFIKNKCNIPFYTIIIDSLGNCLICTCDGWLPLPVGKVFDFYSIDEVLSSPAAKLIQKDVSDGMFSWCAIDHCGIRNGDIIKNRFSLTINIDESCNLHCPSCRRSAIMISEGPEFEKKIKMIERIMQWLDIFDRPIDIRTSGSGDPLASHITRPLIKNFKPKQSQNFYIGTNGLLIKKQLADAPIFNQVRGLDISIDAGSREIYQDVRRPGNWNVLLDNLDFLRHNGKHIDVKLSFILQNKNYKDLPNFVNLCKSHGFKGNITQLDDWGTWNRHTTDLADSWTIINGSFQHQDVLNPNHPNYLEARLIVQGLINETDITFNPFILKQFNF